MKTLPAPQKSQEKPRWNNPTANWGAYTLAYLSLGALALCLIASMPLLPLIDLPEHVAQAVIWANPHIFPDYRLHPFTPYLTGVILIGTLSKSLGPILAYKITLALLILSLPLSLRELFKALNPPSSPRSPKPQRSDWLALVGFPLSFGFAFHMGFLNFCLAVPLSLWILALIGKERARQAITPQKTLGLTALFTLLFFTHPVALALTLLLYPCFAQKWAPSKYLPLLLPVLLLLTWLATQTPKASDAMSFSLQGGRIPTKPLPLNLSDRATELLSYIQGGEWKILPQGSPLALSSLGLSCLLLYLPKKKITKPHPGAQKPRPGAQKPRPLSPRPHHPHLPLHPSSLLQHPLCRGTPHHFYRHLCPRPLAKPPRARPNGSPPKMENRGPPSHPHPQPPPPHPSPPPNSKPTEKLPRPRQNSQPYPRKNLCPKASSQQLRRKNQTLLLLERMDCHPKSRHPLRIYPSLPPPHSKDCRKTHTDPPTHPHQ